MEILQMLQDCYKNKSTFKKTFCWVGFNDAIKLSKPIKDMSKEDEFSCIANWIMHKMPKREAVTIRFEASGQAYQAKVGHNGQRLYVNKSILTTAVSEPTLYVWQEEDTYNALTADKIRSAVQRADLINRQKEQEAAQEIMEVFTSSEEKKGERENAN